jgi:hypothetical protein
MTLQKFSIGLALTIAVMGLGMLFALALGGASTNVRAADSTDNTRSINVSGVGAIGAKPDIARATFGVETLQRTLEGALAENNQRMNSVIAELKKQGLAERDIQTVNFSVSAERLFNNGVPGPITGYRVSNNVRVMIRQLERVGAIIDQAIGAGANTVGGISFSINDVKSMQTQARALAVADAKAKAQELAKAAGIELGRVLTIVETGVSVPQSAERAAISPLAQSVPIEGGELSVTVSVQIIYAIQ